MFSGIAVAGRETVARLATSLSAEFRPVVIGLLTDRSSHVRGIAIETLTRTRLDPAEAPAIEALLTRAASDLRRGALTMLASLPPVAAQASAARLAASKDERQRDAGAELVRLLGPVPSDTGTSRSDTPRTGTPGAGGDKPVDLRATYLGRAHRADRAEVAEEARPPDRSTVGAAAAGDRRARRQAPRRPGDPRQLARQAGDALRRRQALPDALRTRLRTGLAGDADDAGSASRMVLGEVFRAWWAERPDALRGPDDGRDALRAHALAATSPPRWLGFAGGSVVAALVPASGERRPDRLVARPAAPVHRQPAVRAHPPRRRQARHVLAGGRACERSRHRRVPGRA